MEYSDGVYTIINSGTDTYLLLQPLNPIANNYYYISITCTIPFGVTSSFGFPNSGSNSRVLKNGYNAWIGKYISGNMTLDDSYGQSYAGTTFRNVNLIDLNKMFGSDEGIVSALGLNSVSEITSDKAIETFERLFPQEYYAHRTQPPKSNPNPFGIFPQYLIFIIKAISDAQDGPKTGLPKVGEKRKSTK